MKRIQLFILAVLLICSTSLASVTVQTQRVQYTAAAADQTVFAYTWRVLDEDDMDVFVDGVLTTAYSVSNVGTLAGGNITFNTGRTAGEVITIIRNMPLSQETSYPAGGRLSTVNLEKNLDRLTMFTQDLAEEVGRAPKLPGTSTQSGLTFPEGTSATDRATKVPAWNSDGTDLELIAATNVDATSVIAVQGDMVQGSSSGAAEKLAIGSAGDILTVSSGKLTYDISRNVAWKKGTDIAGAAALPIPNENANYFDVDGTPTITSISATNLGTGSLVRLHFDTVGTLTHNASDLVLPGGFDIEVNVGDEFTFLQYDTDDYRLVGSGQAFDPNTRTITGTDTATVNDDTILASTGSDFTLDLYTTSGNKDKSLRIVNTGANTLTIDPAGSELINGSSTLSLANQYSSVQITTDGSEWFTKAQDTVGSGGQLKVVQVVNTSTGAVATGTTAFPVDDTIPQNTEGNEFMTLAITPSDAASTLRIDIVIHITSDNDAQMRAALFQDSTANALAVATINTDISHANNIKFTHYMTAGTTSSTTFKVRGGSGSGTITLNGVSGGRLYGGVLLSNITITEYN